MNDKIITELKLKNLSKKIQKSNKRIFIISFIFIIIFFIGFLFKNITLNAPAIPIFSIFLLLFFWVISLGYRIEFIFKELLT